MKSSLRILLASLVLALCVGVGQTVMAQKNHTLEIANGVVYIDGDALPAEALPADLDLGDFQARLNYAGDAKPLLEIGGVLYTVEDRRLVEVVDQDEQLGPGRVSVFFRDGTETPDPDYTLRALPESIQVAERSDELAFPDGNVTLQLRGHVYSQEANRLAEIARLNETESAIVRQWLPRITVQSYLQDVQNQNTQLYERLVRESRMESEAQGLAAEVRRMPDGGERDALIASLEESLEAIFELKQQNRRREIEQLEAQLTDLQDRLEKREAYRQRIIEERLLELTGEPNPRDW